MPRSPLLFVVIVAAAAFPAIVDAQTASAELNLQVEDPAGMPMVAAGHLRNAAAHSDLAFTTDAQGSYAVSSIPPGVYTLEVSREGFAPQTLNLDLRAGKPVSRVVKMALSSGESRVDVVETMPLPGVDLAIEQVPVSVQTAGQDEIERTGAIDLAGFMNRRINGVYLNEMQGNPFQADLNYRGYTASPLLGTPQGISVYLDGVRQNQPFGDVVSWDLIQDNVVDSMTLVSGSQPLFGLNSLGGAISIQTRDGVTSPGLSGDITYGSSGRKALEAAWGGGAPVGFNWFLGRPHFMKADGARHRQPMFVRSSRGSAGRTGERVWRSVSVSHTTR